MYLIISVETAGGGGTVRQAVVNEFNSVLGFPEEAHDWVFGDLGLHFHGVCD